MLIGIFSTISIIVVLGIAFIIYRRYTKKLTNLKSEMATKKTEMLIELNEVKQKLIEKKAKISETTQSLLQATNERKILCKECVRENKEQIEFYFQHKDDIQAEPVVSQTDRFDDTEMPEDDSIQEVKIESLITELDTPIEYARHIIEKHPSSQRLEWAQTYLEVMGEDATKSTSEIETNPMENEN